MDVFKLLESTITHSTENYDEAIKTLQTLIKAKENEITYRRNLICMLEESKVKYEKKLRGIDSNTNSIATPNPIAATSQQSLANSSDLDIPLPTDSSENRTSLDRRLTELLKTFPNLTQAGSEPTTNNNNVKSAPGYYTQHPPPVPITSAPPLMAMMRFPPPSLVPPATHQIVNPASQENHDTADMDLSDYEESGNSMPTTTFSAGLIPMVASAMQQGAGGKQHLQAEAQQSYVAGQQYNTPIQYTPRLNPLPFDPSIMEPRLRDSSSSSGSRDKHSQSERGSHRHSGSSGGSSAGAKHGSDKNKYTSSSSSSHSSSRKRR